MIKRLTNISSHLLHIILLGLVSLSCSDADDQSFDASQIEAWGYTKQHPLIIGLDADYAPLQYVDANGAPQGYDVRFTNILMDRLHIPHSYHPNSWEDISNDVLHGDVDLGMMIYSAYRKDSTNYSRAVFRLYYQVVYQKKSDDERFDFRNLKGKRIAYLKSKPVGEMLTSEGAQKFSVTDLEEAMFDLAKGKYDAVICYRYQAKYLIDLHGFTQLLTDDISLPPREYCYVSHNKQLIELIDHELLKMEREGVTDDVYDIKSTFGAIIIPTWVWYVLTGLIITSLIIINIIYWNSRKQLTKANKELELNNRQLTTRNQELVIAREKAMESDCLKTAFIQNMTHQIRTPLNIVTGFAQVINEELEHLSKEETKMMVDKMMRNANNITTIVDNLLDLSIYQSRIRLSKDDMVNCHALCHEVAGMMMLDHPDKVTLNIELTAPKDLCIKTNQDTITKILLELLTNANKFTEQGHITLTCQQTDDNTVTFTVTDTGIGIPVEDHARIFIQFYKHNEFTEGLGLGLAICQQSLMLLGGTIKVDADYKEGARFIITHPIH